MENGKPNANGKRPLRERLPKRLLRERLSSNGKGTEDRRFVQINKLRGNLPNWPSPGRPLGSKNSIPKRFTEAFLRGCEKHGSDGKGTDGLDGYGYYLACDPKVGGALIARILPQRVQQSVDPQSALGQLLEAARARLQYERSRTIQGTVTKLT